MKKEFVLVEEVLTALTDAFKKCYAGANKTCQEVLSGHVDECAKWMSKHGFDCDLPSKTAGRLYCMTGPIHERDIQYCREELGFNVYKSTSTPKPTTTTPLPTTTTTTTTVPPTSTASDNMSKILIGGLIVLVVFQFAALIVCMMCRRKQSESQDLEDGGIKKKEQKTSGITGGTRTGTEITEKKTKKKKNKKGKKDTKKKTNTKGTTGTTGSEI